MDKKIFSLLLIILALFSIAGVNATDNMTLSENNDFLQENEYDLDYDEEVDAYIAGFYDNQSSVILNPDSVNLNVKNITVNDEEGEWNYYLSTFKLNNVEYTAVKLLPTSGVFANLLTVKFNPNEYDVYDGIFYKLDSNNHIVDIIDGYNYELIDGQYYRRVGLFAEIGYEVNDDYCIINNECYKFSGTYSPFVVGFFQKAVEGVDYTVDDAKYHDIDGNIIENFVKHYFHYDEDFGTDIVINGNYLDSLDGIYYRSYCNRYGLSPYNYIKANSSFYKVIEGKETYNATETWYGEEYEVEKNNEYVLIDGKLYTFKDNKISDLPINLTKESNYNVKVSDVIKYFKGPERFIVRVSDEKGNPITKVSVKMTINGQEYIRDTDNQGQASIPLNLNSGVYDIVTDYNGNKYYSTVTINPTVVSNDFSKIFRNDTQYYGKFIDSKGNLLKNTDVKFNIHGVFYTRTTNNQGIAKMNINLDPGSYVLTAYNPSTGEECGNIIKVLPSIVENYDLTKYYKNDSQYRIRLLDAQGNYAGAGACVDFNINGVFYTRYSDAKGYVKMNINLNPGTYVITANYNGLMTSNKITVKSVLDAKDVSMKFRDGTKFEAKLIDGQGKPYANQNIIFNINGVFYNRVTDENGIARLNINLMPNNYIITSSYNGLYIGNNVRITPDPLYYTIGTNPLDYDYYMNEYNKFSFDWYYSPQWDAMVRTIYDIYGNQGMEIKDSDVHYGIKYVCWQESTGYTYDLNKKGELISVSSMGDYYVEYKTYDYNNNEIIYHNIYLPNYDTEITAEIDGYNVNVQQWRTPSYSEVDILVYDTAGNIVDLFSYDTMILNNGKWYGPYDKAANWDRSTYHKWHMDPNSRTTEVAVKIRPM